MTTAKKKPTLSTSALVKILQGKRIAPSAHQMTPKQIKEELIEEEWEQTEAGRAVAQAYSQWARANGLSGSDRYLTAQEEQARAEAAIRDLEKRLERAETRLAAAKARGDVPGIERFSRRVSGLEEQLERLFPISNIPLHWSWDEEVPAGFRSCLKCSEMVEKWYVKSIGYTLCPQHYRELSAKQLLH